MSGGPGGPSRGPASGDPRALNLAASLDDRPRDMAQLVLWRQGLPQPTSFQVEETEGRRVLDDWEKYTSWLKSPEVGPPPTSWLQFTTYDTGQGRRSTSRYAWDDLVGVTLEYAVIPFAH